MISSKAKNSKLESIKLRWKDSLGFKPIISYLYFLWIFIWKKIGTIVLPIVAFVIPIILSTVAIIIYFSTNNTQIASVITMINTYVVFIITACFIVNKTINVFKDCESEGVELLIISKPIERWQVIISKYFMILLLTISISLINFVCFTICNLIINFEVNLNNWTSPEIIQNSFKGAAMVLLVSIIVCILFSSIASLLSLKFSTKVSSSLPLTFYSIFTVFSFSAQSIANTQMFSYFFTDSVNYQIVNDKLVISSNPNALTVKSRDQLVTEWNNTVNSVVWYKAIKWIDFMLPLMELQNNQQAQVAIYSIDQELQNFADPNYSYKVELVGADSFVVSHLTNQSPNEGIILLWVFISCGLLGLSGALYIKKDFK